MLIDAARNLTVLGQRFNATLEDIEALLTGVDAGAPAAYRWGSFLSSPAARTASFVSETSFMVAVISFSPSTAQRVSVEPSDM